MNTCWVASVDGSIISDRGTYFLILNYRLQIDQFVFENTAAVYNTYENMLWKISIYNTALPLQFVNFIKAFEKDGWEYAYQQREI